VKNLEVLEPYETQCDQRDRPSRIVQNLLDTSRFSVGTDSDCAGDVADFGSGTHPGSRASGARQLSLRTA